VKALADRLRKLAERMHERVRREFWAYVPDESLTNEERLNEAYRGIRPAPVIRRNPIIPRGNFVQTARSGAANRRFLDREFCHVAGSSVSVFISRIPTRIIWGGKIERDQVEDYARRKG